MKLPKSARLHHRSLQERLFSTGIKVHEYPIKMIWNALSMEELHSNFRNTIPELIGPVQVLVSIPKKKLRKAVDRVLMRRRIREAFRLNRGELLEVVKELPQVRTLSIGLVYMKENVAAYEEIEDKMLKLIDKLSIRLKERFNTTDEENNIENSDIAH